MARTTNPDIHLRRRAQLVDAVFRIVQRDGIEHVSVRNVAAEAGLSMGSLRHYFATQAELLAFSLGEVERRLRARLAEIDPTGDPRPVLHQLVPMTPETRTEHQIWLAFLGRATVDPALHELSARIYDDTRALIARLTRSELETEHLYALVDGLALHAVLRPEEWPPERLAAVIDHHVAGAGGPGQGPPQGRDGRRFNAH